MAAAFRDADRIDLADYSRSHRPPPIPQSPTTTTTTDPARKRAASHSAGSAGADHQSATRANSKRGRGGDDAADGRRRGSLPFLRRTLSSASTKSHSKNDSDSTVPPVPQVPNTRISQAHAEAAARRAGSNTTTTEGARRSAEEASSSMLRKVSSRSRQEKERQIREAAQAAAAPKQPPSLPLPTFTEESQHESRDSVAIFNSAYTHSAGTSQPRATANFSRPAMPFANNMNSSSSPAYAARSADVAANSSSPAVASRGNGEYVLDNHPESMAHRGRYSYASSVGQVNAVNSPRRVRRRKDPTPFNVLVIGAKNSGKTSFISFLRHSLAIPAHRQSSDDAPEPEIGGNRSSFKSDYLETEIDGERVGLTLWDSAGLEKNIVDLQLREMTAFVEAKFEDTFVEEQKVMRSPGVKDTHIHCVFLILDPVRLDSTIAESPAFHKNGSHSGSLDEYLDLQVLRALWGKTTVIPVISKADTLTVSHMKFLKRAVWEALRGANLNPLEALELEEDDDDDDNDDEEEDSSEEAELPTTKSWKSHKRQSSMSAAALTADDEAPYLPMSILSPDIHDLPPFVPASRAAKPDKVGRKFPWGFADPNDAEHCDFGRFRDSIFSEWRSELRELSRTKWYENWRTSRLQNLPGARQRIKGGVTPVAAVPKEGRSASGSRQFSPPNVVASMPSNSSLAAGSTIPRSVSNMTNTTAATSAATGDKTRDFSGSSQVGSGRGGTYRSVESYK